MITLVLTESKIYPSSCYSKTGHKFLLTHPLSQWFLATNITDLQWNLMPCLPTFTIAFCLMYKEQKMEN